MIFTIITYFELHLLTKNANKYFFDYSVGSHHLLIIYLLKTLYLLRMVAFGIKKLTFFQHFFFHSTFFHGRVKDFHYHHLFLATPSHKKCKRILF